MVFSLVVGGTNIHFGEVRRKDEALLAARTNAEHLAAVAERERIARDLHDLLGHTLSVIVIKSELASKLADIDPKRAASEIRDVERISRNALAEVRHAIHGYRGERVEQELATARTALEARGVTLVEDVPALQVEPAIERALALALREALTNVLRHSGATTCDVRGEVTPRSVRLIVQDDGVGGGEREGAGLSGMRVRLAEIGGTVHRDGSRGTRLVLSVPLAHDLPAEVAAS
jgi:two-component system sensor histidine kinase DesK